MTLSIQNSSERETAQEISARILMPLREEQQEERRRILCQLFSQGGDTVFAAGNPCRVIRGISECDRSPTSW